MKKLRLKSGLTQKKLAVIVGVSQAHIAKIELGKVDPRLSTVNRIMNALRIERTGECADVMTQGVIFARSSDTVLKASEIMVRNAVSQLPVTEGNKIVGKITEQGIVRNLRSDLSVEKVSEVMEPPMPEVTEDASIDVVREILERSVGILVRRGRETVGIVTRSDLLKTLR